MATCLSCGGIFNNHFAVNLLQKPSVKEFQISHEHDKTLHRTIAMLHLDTNHKCPINGIFHCRCGYYYHSSIFKANKPFPHRPQREGASTHYKSRAKSSTNGVGIKTPLQEVYIYIHTHTPFNGPCPGLPGWAGNRKVKTNLDFTEAGDSE